MAKTSCIVLIEFTQYRENELHRSYQVYSVWRKRAASFLSSLLSIVKTSCVVLSTFTQYRENELHRSYQVYSVSRKRAALFLSSLLSMAKTSCIVVIKFTQYGEVSRKLGIETRSFLLFLHAYGRMKFEPDSCLAVAYSIHLQPSVVQQLMMMMMNCFCGMVDRRKAFSLISSRDHCQRSSPSGRVWACAEPEFRLS